MWGLQGAAPGMGASTDGNWGDATELLLEVPLPGWLLSCLPFPDSQRNKDLLWDHGVPGGFLGAAHGGCRRGLLQLPHISSPPTPRASLQRDAHTPGPARWVQQGMSPPGVCSPDLSHSCLQLRVVVAPTSTQGSTMGAGTGHASPSALEKSPARTRWVGGCPMEQHMGLSNAMPGESPKPPGYRGGI